MGVEVEIHLQLTAIIGNFYINLFIITFTFLNIGENIQKLLRFKFYVRKKIISNIVFYVEQFQAV